MSKLDFDGLAKSLLLRSRELCASWLPGGKMNGREYVCGSLRGEAGESFSVNTESGKWADFSAGQKGGDLISLYAAIHGVDMGQAYRELEAYAPSLAPVEKKPSPPGDDDLGPLPPDLVPPSLYKKSHGEPSKVWTYLDRTGAPSFFVARYDSDSGKVFAPWSWSKSGQKMVQKGWPAPRPLYGLELLDLNPDKAILLTEGEKSADAARLITAGSAYICMTWPNGSHAVDKTDLTPIYGRKILLWPDADRPGREAMAKLGAILVQHCPEVKIIQVPEILETESKGWDAADALNEGFDLARFKDWAKPLIQLVTPPPPIVDKSVEAVHKPEDKIKHRVKESANLVLEKCKVTRTSKTDLRPLSNEDNVLRILEGHEPFQDLCWYDEFHDRIMTKWNTGELRSWAKSDTLDLMIYFQREYQFTKIRKFTIEDAINAFAHKHRRNEPKDWMLSLAHDGQPRIEEFFINFCGADDNEYTRAISKNWWLSLVARVLNPGSKVDNMLILEGKTGISKSSMLDAIGGKFYFEPQENVSDKDFLRATRGKFLIEVSELDAFEGASNKKKKRILSTRIDRVRSLYATDHEDKPRWFLFVGTTNESKYLDDEHGDRRYWPLLIKFVLLDEIKQLREQLFAEAVALFKAGATWWQVPDSALNEQAARKEADPWQEAIAKWLENRMPFQMSELMLYLGFEFNKMDLKTQRRIGSILRGLGWDNKPRYIDGKSLRIWRSTTHPEQMELSINNVSHLPIVNSVRNYADDIKV